ncbi:MAG: lipocalin family protein [Rhodocyclaceae bacterium]|nr:lipocalin family protein [Rhodocyclaceae bacterium]
MSSHLLLRALAATLACLATSARAEVPVVSVAEVALARYVGKWYEIANFPLHFQRQCIGDTTAEYGLTPGGEMAVTNRCRTDRGFDEARGKAVVVAGSGNARLSVSFLWPFRSDFWVIGIDAEDRWAVIGNPDRKSLWVFSRTPQLSKELLAAALDAAAAQGFDLTQLRYTVQSVARKSEPEAP